MQQFLRLCLWQVLIISISCFSMPISAEDGGIRIRGPKSTDAFPYDRYGPITGNDTLWNIALKVRPDPRLSVYQVMQALFENNPDAFKDSNLNHMINGQYLKIPSIEAMRAISTENAQKKSRSDDKAWQKKVVKVASKKAKTPEDASVNKKDLDAAKSEINVQLKAIDTTQQQRLATIQNDVLDSIDGLQSLLKENEALRKRLGSFNEQLDVMQNEVAKSKEIKLQMDNMIALQQALLAKAEAREQALLLEQQKAELEGNSIMSSSWFIALMATLPAILVLALIAILLRRRSNKDNDAKPASTKKEKLTEQEPEASVAAAEEPKTVDNELSLEDDVSLDSELSLDDELSIDLSEVDDDQDDLFSDDLSSLDDELLDDDVVQLDDDLADLDDLEDISLDDDLETLALDEDIVESDALEGGQLDQSDLDSLFAGLEDEPNDSDDTIDILDSDLVEQGDLDSLLSESSDEDLVVSEDEELMNKPEDIDALLDASLEENTDVSDPDDIGALLDASVEENTDVSDPDDIDALLDASVEENKNVTDPDDIDALLDASVEENKNVTDPDDIDALLDASVEENKNVTDPDDIDALLDASVEENKDVSDPDDIDALLDSINAADDAPESEPEATADEDAVEDDNANDNVDVSDPDDIDALLDSINGADDAPEPEPGAEATADEDANDNVDVADPDDIDALLESINAADDAPEPGAEATADEDANDNVDVADPDDIDALLASINAADDAPESELEATADNDAVEDAHANVDVSDPDDIDALLDSINAADDAPEPESGPEATTDNDAVEDAYAKVDDNVDVSDPDDIDALLDSINGADDAPEPEPESEATTDNDAVEDANDNVDVSDPDDIDALLDSINGADDAPELETTVTKNAEAEDITETGNESSADESTEDENTKLINNFSDEYVKSFIDADFSELLDEFVDESEVSQDSDTPDSHSNDGDGEAISDDFDIDALIDEVNDTAQINEEEPLDIGDDLLDTEITDDELLSVDPESESLENTTDNIDEETLQALSGDFDESTLSQLLNDEKEVDSMIELSPDFTDSNVLADLLAEDGYVDEQAGIDTSKKESKEVVDGIKELDNLDFDDLLANIEEETSTSSNEEFEFSENFDIGDGFDSDIVEENASEDSEVDDKNNEKDFISVDSLLSDSLLDGKPTEPYEKMNIDVGLGEFPEFSGNITEGDIDDDDNGIAAKLDLAKVYLEIGDNENAEVILLDVVKQGDAQQQFDAQQLLDNIN